MNFLIRFIIKILPSKDYSFALTLHNFSNTDYKWLEKTLDKLSDQFEFIDPNKADQILTRKENRKRILLTFDDGYKSNRFVAEKILKPRGIKALFFITSSFVGLKGKKSSNFAKKNFYPKSICPYRYKYSLEALSWSDIKWLIKEGHVIGAHTKTHPDLAKLKQSDVDIEINQSADIIEEKIGISIKHFSYPFGNISSVNKQCIKLASQRFDMAFSNIRGGLNESKNNHFLFRHNLVPGTPSWKIKAITNGKLDWLYTFSRLIYSRK